jgi:mRNA-degrading endonuclease RelE of RelBE toxin-antitoxin system
MSYEIIAVPEFGRELKILAKKYPSLKVEIAVIIDELAENPTPTILAHGLNRGLNKPLVIILSF